MASCIHAGILYFINVGVSITAIPPGSRTSGSFASPYYFASLTLFQLHPVICNYLNKPCPLPCMYLCTCYFFLIGMSFSPLFVLYSFNGGHSETSKSTRMTAEIIPYHLLPSYSSWTLLLAFHLSNYSLTFCCIYSLLLYNEFLRVGL